MTVRVAVDASCLAWPPSGTRRFTELVLNEMARDERVALHLITNASSPVTAFPGVPETARRQKGAILWRARVLGPEARRSADVLWNPFLKTTVLPLSIPFVVTVHDLSPLMHRGTKDWREVAAMRTTGRWGVRRSAQVIAVSKATKADVHALWAVDQAKITAVPLAVDPRFHPGDRNASQRRVASRWGLYAPFTLAVGTIEPRKGYDLLPPLAALLPDLPVVVVGRPGPRSADLMRALGPSCRVLESVDDTELQDLYRAAEVLLTPSVYEGFGLTPMEAMASGTPAVVAAGAGALEEIYAGVAPVVERRADLWAVAVRDVLAHRDDYVVRGLALARARSWTDVAREIADVLIRVGEASQR